MALKPGRQVDLGELIMDISVNSQETPAMDFSGWRGGANAISIDGPSVLDGTVKIQVTNSLPSETQEGDVDEYGSIWKDKQSAGADITVPADGHVTMKAVDYKQLRLVSSSVETENRRFRIIGYEPAS